MAQHRTSRRRPRVLMGALYALPVAFWAWSASAQLPARETVALERRADLPCAMPGAGWSNLFFAGDSTTPGGRVASFAVLSGGVAVDVVEQRAAGGPPTYAIRAASGEAAQALALERVSPKLRCATVELPVGIAAVPVRLQVAIPDAEPYVYGRIAEYRVGRLPTAE